MSNKRKAKDEAKLAIKKEKAAKLDESAPAASASASAAAASASGAVATTNLTAAKSDSALVVLATALRKSTDVRILATVAASEAKRREQVALKEEADLYASIPSGKILFMPNGVCYHARGGAMLPVVPFYNAKPDMFVCQSCGAKSDIEAHESFTARYGSETLLQFVYCKHNPVCRGRINRSLTYIKDFLSTTIFYPRGFATKFVVKIRRMLDSAILSVVVGGVEFGSAVDGSWFVALMLKRDQAPKFTSICMPLARFLSTVHIIRKTLPPAVVGSATPVASMAQVPQTGTDLDRKAADREPSDSKSDAKKIEPFPLYVMGINTHEFPTESADDYYTFGPIRKQIHQARVHTGELKLVEATVPPPILFDGYRFLPPDSTAGTDCIASFSAADLAGPSALGNLGIPYPFALPIGVQEARHVKSPPSAPPTSIEFVFPFGKPPSVTTSNNQSLAASAAAVRSDSGSAAAAAAATTINLIADEDAIISPL